MRHTHRHTQKDLVASLEKVGLKFSYLELVQEGDYLPTDADWNYKDVPHLNVVHELVDATIASIDDETMASVLMQKAVGLRFPITTFTYDSGNDRQTCFFNVFFYQLIIESKWEQLGPLRTRVTTRYAIGSAPFWQLFVPIVKWVLARNYENLMTTDIAMRSRRGELRKWGFTFKGDKAPYSYRATMKLQEANVIPPAGIATPTPPSATLSLRELERDKVITIGQADHRGLRFQLEDGVVRVFPRMCPHEGANLDHSSCKNGQIACPWHARKFAPLATLALGKGQKVATSEHFELTLEGDSLHVVPRTAEGVPAKSSG